MDSTQPLDDSRYQNLSLEAKAQLIQSKGTFIEAEDFYSFRIDFYTYNANSVEITYDYSGALVSVEFFDPGQSKRSPQFSLTPR